MEKERTGRGIPEITPEQRAAALERARAARAARKEARLSVAAGDVDPLGVLDDPQGAFVRMPVRQFLTSVPGVGTVIADRVMVTCGIAANRRVGGLGSRQREALAAELRAVTGR